MSIGLAFYGGIYNFFSIWILCLLQVVPFLLAYVAGAGLMEMGSAPLRHKLKETLAVPFCCLLGFGIFYAALEASPTRLAAFLFHHHSIFLQMGGVILFLVSFYFLGVLKVSDAMEKLARMGGAFLVGSVLGLAYQPCITPILSGIVNLIKDPDYFSRGFVFLIAYTLGLISSIAVVSFGAVWILSHEKLKAFRPYAIKVCGLLLLVISALILLQKMTVYKSFLVGM